MSQEKEDKVEKPEDGESAVKGPRPQTTAAPAVRTVEGAIEGIVATGSGPLENAAVWFAELKTVTDAKGRFVLEHIPAGTITLQVTSPTPRFQNSTLQVTVNPDEKANAFVFLGESAGTVEGDVIDEKGHPLVNAKVFGLFRATAGTETVKVDKRGRYSFMNVSPGTHFIRAKAAGFMTEGKSVEVVGSKSTTCSFALKAGSVSLVGRVMDSEGRGVAAEVYLMKGGIVVTKVDTKAGKGSYAFHDLIPANYELTIAAPGHAPKGWVGKLEKDEVVEFKLEPQPTPEPSADPTARFG